MGKSQVNKSDTLPWHLWGCLAIAFMIPFAKKFVPGFIVLLGIYSIAYFIRRKKISAPSRKISLILLAAIFCLLGLGLLWSEHMDAGINELGIKFSFMAFPIIGWLMPSINHKQLQQIAIAFVWGCFAFVILALSYGTYRSIHYNDISWLGYQRLGIYLHPTYAATYQSMAFFILMYHAAHRNYLLRKAWFHYVVCGVMLIFISMLASKAGLIAALISIVMAAVILIQKKRSPRQIIVSTIAAFFILLASTYFAPGTSERVEAAVEDVSSNVTNNVQDDVNTDIPPALPTEAKSSTALRFVTWNAAISVLGKQPMGVGTGDTESAMVEAYLSKDEVYAAEKKLNAHNQFLQIGAEVGWLGLVLLIVCMTAFTYDAFKLKSLVMLNFIILCAMNFLFESFLEVQAGIVFFCFWIMVFAKTDHT